MIFNPILNWIENLIFYDKQSSFTILRKEEHGGNKTFNSCEEFKNSYRENQLHPQDLKMAVAEWLINKLEPVRKYFEEPERKAALEKLESLIAK